MTWHQKLLCRLVLLVAQMVARLAGEDEVGRELKHIASHIAVSQPEEMNRMVLSQPPEPLRPISTIVRDDA